MPKARIYKPSKTAMQSGRAKTKKWRLEFAPSEAKKLDPLMGWTGSGDTRRQVRLYFDSEDAALRFAKKHGIEVTLEEPAKKGRFRPKSYADNFRWDAVEK